MRSSYQLHLDVRILITTLLLLCAVEGGHIANNTVCSTILDDDLYQRMIQAGNCNPYLPSTTNRVSACDNVFNVGVDYVYVPNKRVRGRQQTLRLYLEDVTASIALVGVSNQQCQDAVVKALCVHFYLPCGSNSSIHVPQFLCPDTCRYLTDDVCRDIWPIAVEQLRTGLTPSLRNMGLDLPVCNNTSEIIASLNLSDDCCSNGGLVIPEMTTSFTTVPATTSRAPVSATTSRAVVTAIPSLHHTQEPNATNVDALIIGASVGSAVGVAMLATAVLAVLITVVLCLKKIWADKTPQVDISMEPSTRMYVPSVGQDSVTAQTSPVGVDVNTLTLPSQQEPFRSRVSSTHMRQLSNFIIPKRQLQLVETLGQGEFGIVYRGLLLRKNTMPIAVAVKTLKGQFSSNDISLIMEESLKMKSFDHVNVLNLLGVCVHTGSAPYIVMPLMSHGSLLSYLKKERHNLTVAEGSDIELVLSSQKQLLSMCLQVAQGMAYLASQKFVHRDLAARNCMVASTGVIKVADFGLTEDVYQRNYFRQGSSTSIKLPIKWMAVESLHDRVFSEKSDVWSFGVTSWEVFSLGRMPYPTTSPAEVMKLLDNGSRLTQPTNAACSDEIFCVMMTCWKENPDKRPTFDELVNTISSILKPLADYMDFSDVYCKENNTEGSKYDRLGNKYDQLEKTQIAT